MKMVFGTAFLILFISFTLGAMEEKPSTRALEFAEEKSSGEKELPSSNSQKKYIIFELDDVLTQAAEDVALQEHFNYLNLSNDIWFLRLGDLTAWIVGTLAGNKVRAETHKISTLLMHVLCQNHIFDDLKGDTNVLYRGRPLPSLWCGGYYLDRITGEEAIRLAQETIAQHTPDNKLSPEFFEFAQRLDFNPAQDIRKYLDLAVEVGFDPEREVNYLKPVEKGFALARDCAANPNNRVFIFSNKNTHTMEELVARYRDFFELFKGNIITSGAEGVLKPNPEFYKKIIDDYGIDIDNCYFVDSQAEYLQPALDLGARAIEINPDIESDYDELRADFIAEGIILEKS